MTELVRAGTVDELASAGCLTVDTKAGELCIVEDGGRYFAVDNFCPHMGASLERGVISNGAIVCPWHRARFVLATGKCLDLYAADISSYPVTVEDSVIYVKPTPIGAQDSVGSPSS